MEKAVWNLSNNKTQIKKISMLNIESNNHNEIIEVGEDCAKVNQDKTV